MTALTTYRVQVELWLEIESDEPEAAENEAHLLLNKFVQDSEYRAEFFLNDGTEEVEVE